MGQQRIQKTKSKASAEETSADVSNSDVTNAELSEQTDEVLGSIDDVLDDQLLADIDDVLEQDAEQFVAGYVQAGGE